MRLTQKTRDIAPSATIKIADKVRELQAQGATILQFGTGEPHVTTPTFINDAARTAMERGETHYSHSRGVPVLRKALAAFYNNRFNTKLEPNHHVLVTPGAKQAILYLFFALLEEGDEVLIPNPGWVSYAEMAKLA